MKIYEAETLTAATKSRAKQYEELKKEVAALKKEFQGIVGLDNEFQGAGATAIKSFYEAQIEVADAWMELFTTQISFFGRHTGQSGRGGPLRKYGGRGSLFRWRSLKRHQPSEVAC
ncbi:T7SS effector LXG polymorphic toxin [Peribacillus frigoritolerans]|nr:T7SS effector LXG polymorphic toxin [Peribacillus frigoritolerans]